MDAALRARAIAEWRGLPEKRPAPDRWQAAVDVLPKLMQRLGLKERLHEVEVIEAWGQIVGEFIAAHSAPWALREGVLSARLLRRALQYELDEVYQMCMCVTL